jgi:hypothetical protein
MLQRHSKKNLLKKIEADDAKKGFSRMAGSYAEKEKQV